MRKDALSWLILFALAGCSSGGSNTAGSPNSPLPSNSSGTNLPPTNPTGRIVVNSLLLRAIPSNIDSLIFRGYDASNNQVYGPETRAKAAQIVLEGVPTSVTQLEIEYLEGTVLRGRGRQNVSVQSSQDTAVNDAGFSDITYALTTLSTPSTQIQLERGQSQPLPVEGLYADNTRADVSGAVLWSSDDAAVAEVDSQGQLQARGIGSAQLTGRIGNISLNVQVQVSKPSVVGLAITPVSPTVLENGQLNFQAQALLADNTTEAAQANWTSSNTSAATIGSDGRALAVQAGATLIQADYQGQHANTTLTVAVDQTLYNLSISPTNLQLPKGMTVKYQATASYANGTIVDVTALTTFISSDLNIANNEISPPPPSDSDWFQLPPPLFPNLPGAPQFYGKSKGPALIQASYENLNAQTPVTVVNTVPLRARVYPAKTTPLAVGQTLQLSTRTTMYDGTYETERSDAIIDSTPHVGVSSSRLATALSQGTDFLTARVPDPPFPNATPNGASYAYSASIPPDYAAVSIEPAVIVIGQALGINFTQAQTGTSMTLLENSSAGLVGILEGGNLLKLPTSTLSLTGTSRLNGLGAGNFSGMAGRAEIFFAGRRSRNDGADYGVVLRLISVANPELVTFADEPNGITTPRVADLDGDGRSDLVYLSGQTLKVRLSDVGVLQTLRVVTTFNRQGPLQLQTGDFNGDSRPDLAVAGPNSVQVFLNDGSANFTAQTVLTTPDGDRVPYHLCSGDVDGDGKSDLCYLTNRFAGNRYWTLFFGSASGQLENPLTGTTGYRVQAMRLGDITGDGKADLVTLQSSTGQAMARDPRDTSLSVFPGGPQGFNVPQVIELFNNRAPLSLVLRRINGDALLDVSVSAASNPSTPTSAILYNLTRTP